MILDIIIIGVVLILVIIGIKRGIAKTLLNALSVIASAICSFLGAGLLSNLIYTTVIAPSVTKNITDSMADSTASAATIIQEAFDSLPEFVTGTFKTLGISIEALTKSANDAAGSADSGVSQAVDFALKPVITSVLSAILIILLFIVFLLIFRYIARKAEKLFHIPIVGTLNRILGGALGFIEGAVICIAFAVVCKVAFVFSQDPLISAEMISQSVVFSAVYNHEILNNIAAFLGAGNDLVQSAGNAVSTEASQIESAVR